ncbi:MAG: trypsin-like peptidase domain-containing protein [Candidatus Kapabacteria bacterium]|nr:trypsin-like peptidase domain-containing protein [Candidatus Kapabacteria bacterium]
MKYLYIFVAFIILTLIKLNGQENYVPSLIKKVISSVVLVQCETSLGSGDIVSIDGYILTNYHVVKDANLANTQIQIKTHNKDLYIAKIIAFDDDLDICLLKTDKLENETDFFIANPDSVNVGEDVICIGNPFGYSEFVTKGIISKFNTPYIFTSASINPGNSGGAMINMKGELVGIPTMSYEGTQNFNFAICPRTIRYFLNKNKINYRKG